MKTSQDRPSLLGVVWLRRELKAEGYSDRAIAAKVHAGEWHRVRRGAYCDGPLWRALSAEDQHRVLARAVLRTAHKTAVLSHVSAAIELGAPAWGIPLTEVHLTRTDGKSGRREAGVVQHRAVLPAEHITTHNGARCVTGDRAAVEVSTVVPVEQALVMVNGLFQVGAASPEVMAALVAQYRFWPYSLTSELVLRLAHPKIESVAESRAYYMFWAEHLPRPEPQVEVVDEAGHLVARLDFVWRDQGVWVEFDGRLKYERFRRRGETLEQFLMREKRREELISQLTGWVCVRINWADLERPRITCQRIRRLLERPTQAPA